MASYFSEFIRLAEKNCPFLIEEISWDGIIVHIGGKNWKFNGFCDWVITNNEIMIVGCHDDNIQEYIKTMVGEEIRGIGHSVEFPSYDPIFILGNGLRIKFFSTSFLDPWTFGFENPENITFVASPSDPNWNINAAD